MLNVDFDFEDKLAGDMIADVAMAKRGSPRMGFSAAFGGPLFNMLLGIGLPFTIQVHSEWKTGQNIDPSKKEKNCHQLSTLASLLQSRSLAPVVKTLYWVSTR